MKRHTIFKLSLAIIVIWWGVTTTHAQSVFAATTYPQSIVQTIKQTSLYTSAQLTTTAGQTLPANSSWRTSTSITPTTTALQLGKNQWVAFNQVLLTSYLNTADDGIATVSLKTGAKVYQFKGNRPYTTNRKLAFGSSWKYQVSYRIFNSSQYPQGYLKVGQNLWVSLSDVDTTANISFINDTQSPRLIAKITTTAPLYYGPSSQSNVLRTLSLGSSWQVLEVIHIAQQISWYRLGNNQWVSSAYVQLKNAPVTTKGIVSVNNYNHGTLVWNTYKTSKYPTGTLLEPYSRWQVFASAYDHFGRTWYQVGRNQWIAATSTFGLTH